MKIATDLSNSNDYTSVSYVSTVKHLSMADMIETQTKEIETLKLIILELIKDDRPDLLLKYMEIFKN